MTDKTYTPDDFAAAEFARHPEGGVAARVITSPGGVPWRRSPGIGISSVVARAVPDAEMAKEGWCPVWECQDRDVHWRYVDLLGDLKEARKERDEARAELVKADAQIEQLKFRDARIKAMQEMHYPACTDTFAEAARESAASKYQGDWDAWEGTPVDDWGFSEAQRQAYVAGAEWALSCLTALPRPEGAEDVQALIDEWADGWGCVSDPSEDGDHGPLADFLAERGVRVVGEEDPR